MAICEDDGHGRGGSRTPKWAIVAAIFVGSLGIAVAAVVSTGTSLVSSPMATASTTKATPWVPRPDFLPKPVPHPGTLVSAQGADNGQAQQENVKWAAKATPPFQAIQKGLTDLGTALNNQDLGGMQKACRTVSIQAEKLQATLPSPRDDMTAEVQGSVDELNQMVTACLADPPDVNGIQTHGNAASNHMQTVAKLSQEK
jgi:hypothetical protein